MGSGMPQVALLHGIISEGLLLCTHLRVVGHIWYKQDILFLCLKIRGTPQTLGNYTSAVSDDLDGHGDGSVRK